MKRVNTTDIYRSENAILVHSHSPRTVYVPLNLSFNLSLLILAVIVITFLLAAEFSRDVFSRRSDFLLCLPAVGGGVLLIAVWAKYVYRKYTDTVVQIDPQHVRLDSRFLWFQRSRMFVRNKNNSVAKMREEIYDHTDNRIVLSNGIDLISWPIYDIEENNRTCSEIQRFFREVPAQDIAESKIAVPDSGWILLEILDIHGEKLVQLPLPDEMYVNPEKNNDIPVWCCRCSHLIPPEKVLSDEGIIICDNCDSVLLLDELVGYSQPKDGRISVRKPRKSEIEIETCYNYSHQLLAPLIFWFFLLMIYTVFTFASFYGTAAVFVICTGYLLYLFLDFRSIHLTPEFCRISRWKTVWSKRIPRKDIIKVVRCKSLVQDEDIIRLEYRGGSFDIERVKSGSVSFTQGLVNHYLYTNPSPDGAKNDPAAYFGGVGASCAEVRAYCPDCHITLSPEELDFVHLSGKCGKCGSAFSFDKSPMRVFTNAATLSITTAKIEETDEQLTITGKPSGWGFVAFLNVLFILGILPFAFFSSGPPKHPMYWVFFVVIVGLIIWTSFAIKHLSRWTISLNNKVLEVSWRCVFFTIRKSIPRNMIQSFEYIDRIPVFDLTPYGSLCPLSTIVAKFFNGGNSFRLPGFYDDEKQEDYDWMMNKLNDYLGRHPINNENHEWR